MYRVEFRVCSVSSLYSYVCVCMCTCFFYVFVCVADAVLKRTPLHFPSGKTDLYISRNSNFQAQMAKAEKLLAQKYASICIHGLGAAINRAINLAMQLQAKSPVPLRISTTTSTVPLIDDLIPTKELLAKAAVERTQIRNNSAIHIELIKEVS
eukprot:m.60113 g.60113  ORF g.60113 m.60113 type:complete len:153 (-) comp7939_c1_seq1:2703-3161(-)